VNGVLEDKEKFLAKNKMGPVEKAAGAGVVKKYRKEKAGVRLSVTGDVYR